MRVFRTPEVTEPSPPPYTPSTSDAQSEAPPHIDDVDEVQGRTQQLSLEANQASRSPSRDVGAPTPTAHYIASRPFERGELLQNEGIILSFLTHPIVLLPLTRADDLPFPEPVETYFNRDVKYQDWNNLKTHLLPPHNLPLGGEKPSASLNADQRHHVNTALAEWNKLFFAPRRICVEAKFELPAQPAADDQARSMPHTNNVPSNRLHRSNSASSSSSSHSDSSISSISSEDIENVPPTTTRNLLLAFREDPTRKQHLRSAVAELRSQFHAEARNILPEERKELRKNYRKEQRDLKKEIRRILRDARNERRNERRARHKAARYQRKVERKARKHGLGGGGGGGAATVMHDQSRSPSYATLPQQESGVAEQGVPLPGARAPAYAPHKAPLPRHSHSHHDRHQQPRGPPPPAQHGCRRGTGLSGRRAPSWGQQSANSAARGLGQWVRAAEDACRVAGQTANEAARQLDTALREGERQLQRGLK